MKRTILYTLLILCAAAKSSAQEKLTHFEVYGGYECFPDMTNKSGWSINAGAGYAFTQKYYMAAMLHCGINNGKFTGMYAGEKTRLSHNLREYMIGIGPGIYLYNGGDKWIHADVLLGYGFGEETKDGSDEAKRKSLDSFATAVRLGLEYQLNNGIILGINAGGYYVGNEIRPAVCAKIGFYTPLL